MFIFRSSFVGCFVQFILYFVDIFTELLFTFVVWTFSHIIACVACGISRWSVDVFLATEPAEDHSSTANKVPGI